MLRITIATLGRLLYWLPDSFSHALSRVLGTLLYLIPGKRRRSLLTNLHHAFPSKSEGQRRRIARESCCRMVETALFVAASTYWTEDDVRSHLGESQQLHDLIETHKADPRPAIILGLHFTLMEAVAMLPAVHPGGVPETAVIYRALKNRDLENWVLHTRQRFGIKMLSRKKGLVESRHILKRKGRVTVLFDQNAGRQGALGLFFGRVASLSELAGTMAEKHDADTVFIYPRRTGFWRATLEGEQLDCPREAASVTSAANAWLERKLAENDDTAADWLWAHNRWKTQDHPSHRLRLEHKRWLIDNASLPRKTLLYVRMPNWLGDVLMALPLLRTVRQGRPDFHITLVAKGHFLPLLEKTGLADRLLPLPDKGGAGYFRTFWHLRREYFDTALLFTNSSRGDIEAWLTRTPQRFGIVRPGKKRPLLTHAYSLPHHYDERAHHQTALWRDFLRHFGLQEEPDCAPLPSTVFAADAPQSITALPAAPIGMIPGTENEPAKRWPVSHWRELIAALLREYPETPLVLFGTKGDANITGRVAHGFPPERVLDLAGKTNLPAFAGALARCKAIICNDTGGMHMANALGTPVVAIFGPTNPVRTGPVFDAPARIVQAPGSAPTGGTPISEVTAQQVLGILPELNL